MLHLFNRMIEIENKDECFELFGYTMKEPDDSIDGSWLKRLYSVLLMMSARQVYMNLL